MAKEKAISTERRPWKLLLWTAIAGLIFGLIGFGELPEDLLRSARNDLHRHHASGDIVIVTFDDQALRQIGRWPWPRSAHAALVDQLTRAGAKRIFFDVNFFAGSEPSGDRAFADALRRSGRVVLAARTRTPGVAAVEQDGLPAPMFANEAQTGSISWQYNYANAVWRIPYSTTLAGKPIRSFASLLANREGPANDKFRIDYSIEPGSIPSLSAAAIASGKFNTAAIRGKDVVLGANSFGLGDLAFVPGTGQMGGVFVHVIAAETLKRGIPFDGGWLPALLVSLLLVTLAATRRRFSVQAAIVAGSAVALTLGPALLEARLLFFDIMPGLFALIIAGSALTRQQFRQRGLIDPVSNLPNLSALRGNRQGRQQAIVAARVLNYEEIVATLPSEQERQLIDQVVGRLKVGSADRVLYHGEGGIFAWFEDPRHPFGNQLEALSAMFRNPARVDGRSIDLTIAFGVEVGSGRSLANRLASALVAADEAAHQGLKWKHHDPESLEDASWKLSILSQLDEAIDRGEVWVAFQPKVEISTRKVIGAEALARWTHPEKGPIAATEFIAAAEQHDRIGKLTDFVLEKAVAAAGQVYERGIDFNIAVNLSARLLADKSFTLRLSALLARHGLPAKHLTLELTETAALANLGEGLDMLGRLRDLGVNISIDDYGTGLSTLEYLKKIPANEIKIDQSFIKGIVDNRSDRLMVQSTIGLAHSLGRQVVAEGVEQREILDVLLELQCDLAQGFAIGRPMSFESLFKRLSQHARRGAA